MLGASLLHQGTEILRRIEDLKASAAKGSTAGIPLLHPWANRLAALKYQAAGREVSLDPASPMLHFDSSGLPMHGVPWSLLEWEITQSESTLVAARLEWNREDVLGIFPFRHRLEMIATVIPGVLEIETILRAGSDNPVPISFGFHPYIGIPGISRELWQLKLPPMQRLRLNDQGIPT